MKFGWSRRPVVFATVLGIVLLQGLLQSGLSAEPSRAVQSLILQASLAASPAPSQPKPFTVPAQSIVAASADGYLPSSWNVTPKGELTFEVPLSVPPGRAGVSAWRSEAISSFSQRTSRSTDSRPCRCSSSV